MKLIRTALLATAAMALPAVPALADGHMQGERHSAESAMTEGEKLQALFEESDERSLALNPISGLFRGDMRRADRLGDFLTDSFFIAARTDTQLNMALLDQIDRSKLSETDQLAYDVFKYNQQQGLKGSTDEIRALTEVRPVNHFSGFHTFYPTFASGQSAAKFNTVEDYENNLSRHQDYIAIGDRSIEKFREGMETGVLETSLTIDRVIKQLDTQLELSLIHI